MSAWQGRLVFLTLCVLSTLGLHARAQDAVAPASVGESIQAYAARFGAEGSPEYTAALRRAIVMAANMQKLEDGSYDRSRSVTLPTGTETQPQVILKIDHDKRFASWVAEAAKSPLSKLNIKGCNNRDIRVIGGERITERSCFPEVVLALEPPSKPFCSGVLVEDQRTLITAAHCLCSSSIEYSIFGLGLQDIDQFRAIVTDKKIYPGVRCSESVSVTPPYDVASLSGRDIAVLRLARDVPENVAQHALLPDSDFAPIFLRRAIKDWWC